MWFVYVLLLCGLTTIYAQTDPCSEEGSVRLLLHGELNSRAGIVEVCHNEVWGTICGESNTEPWAEKNAQVVCRQLGYSGALNSILQDTLPFSSRINDPVPVHYTDVSCLGSELNLTDCPLFEVGPSDNCPHLNDVAITCRSTTEDTAGAGDVRLTEDTADGHGAVQLFDVSLGWIDVCYDSTWGDDEANVVCRQLGYESGIVKIYVYSIGSPALTDLVASSFSCDVNDDAMNECGYGTQNSCPSYERGGVGCFSSTLPEGSIRLAGSDVSYMGRVEILYNGRWGTICNTLWDDTDGELACQELGQENVVNTFAFESPRYHDPSHVKPIWLTNIGCSSDDMELRDCDHDNPIGYAADCGDFTDAELECEVPAGLSGAITAGIFGILSVIVIIVFLLLGFRRNIKRKWNQRNQSGCWRAFTCPCRWIMSLRNTCCVRRNARNRPAVAPSARATASRPTATASRPTATASQSTATASRPTAITSRPAAQASTTPAPEPTPTAAANDTEREPDEPKQETKFTKVPPPSYRAASSFPTADPSSPPLLTDPPPPYPGLPQNPYPPAPYPPGPDFPGCPPPTNLTHPPTLGPAYSPTLDPAYPPQRTDLQSSTPDTT